MITYRKLEDTRSPRISKCYIDGPLGTVRDLAIHDVETNTTTIVNHLTYNAYGQITSQTNPSVTTLIAFTGRPFDSDTGLQNNLNRWYDTETGQWAGMDPMVITASDPNLYRYVSGMPTTFVDPSGLRGYWSGVRQVFLGYKDAACGVVVGGWTVVRHPIQTDKGVCTAVRHPIRTTKAVVNDVKEKSGSGPR